MYASSRGHEKTVRRLLAAEADVNVKDAKGKTALVYVNSPHSYMEFDITVNYNLYINDRSRENIKQFLSSSSKIDFSGKDIEARKALGHAFSDRRDRYPKSSPSKTVQVLLEMQGLNPRMRKDDD